MNEENTQPDTDTISQAAKESVEHNGNIHDEVRDITIEAFSKHHLDIDRIRSVISAVLNGAKAGTGDDSDPEHIKAAFTQVISGLDAALAISAQASTLAIEEATGRIKDFSQQDLKQSMDNIASLEDLLFESISDVSKSSKTVIADTLDDLIKHTKNTGTTVGEAISHEMIGLRKKLERAGQNNAKEMTETTLNFASDVAEAASGFLSGIAKTIKASEVNEKTSEKKQ